jgi:hypothetical protein
MQTQHYRDQGKEEEDKTELMVYRYSQVETGDHRCDLAQPPADPT